MENKKMKIAKIVKAAEASIDSKNFAILTESESVLQGEVSDLLGMLLQAFKEVYNAVPKKEKESVARAIKKISTEIIGEGEENGRTVKGNLS